MEKTKDCCGECPKCGSNDIEWADSFLEDDYYCYKGKCNECGTQLREWYSLQYAETIYDDGEKDENL